MWLIKILPDWIFYSLFFAGLIGLAATYLLRLIPIPFIYMYKTPIQLVSIAALAIGTFMSGAIYDNNAWLERVKEMEEKVAVAAQQSKEANDSINDKVETEKQKIVEKKVYLKEYIEVQSAKDDTQCTIPGWFVEAHNKAAEK